MISRPWEAPGIEAMFGLRILHFRVYYSGGVWRWDRDTSEHRQRDTLVGDG